MKVIALSLALCIGYLSVAHADESNRAQSAPRLEELGLPFLTGSFQRDLFQGHLVRR